jgi:DNA-binding response OmpR family regulator
MWKKFKKIDTPSEDKNNKHVFIVKEDKSNRRFLCRVLERAQYNPIIAEKGSVMEMAASVGPRLIILNSIISGRKTLDLCAKLKSTNETKHIPVLIIAEKDDGVDIIEYYSQNADCFLTKPISKKELIDQVNALCRNF